MIHPRTNRLVLSLLLLCASMSVMSQSQHKVKKGETMESIAEMYGIKVAKLKKANPGLNSVRKGQVIDIPATKKSSSKKGPASTKSPSAKKNSPSMKTNKEKPRQGNRQLTAKEKSAKKGKNKKPLTKAELRAKAEKKERRKEKWRNFRNNTLKPIGTALGNGLKQATTEVTLALVESGKDKLLGKSSSGDYDGDYSSGSSSTRATRGGGDNFTGSYLDPRSGTIDISNQINRLQYFISELDAMAQWVNERSAEIRANGGKGTSSYGQPATNRAKRRMENRTAGQVTGAQRVGSAAYRHMPRLEQEAQPYFAHVEDGLNKYGKGFAIGYINNIKDAKKKQIDGMKRMLANGQTVLDVDDYRNIENHIIDGQSIAHQNAVKAKRSKNEQRSKHNRGRGYRWYEDQLREIDDDPYKYMNNQGLSKSQLISRIKEYQKEMKKRRDNHYTTYGKELTKVSKYETMAPEEFFRN